MEKQEEIHGQQAAYGRSSMMILSPLDENENAPVRVEENLAGNMDADDEGNAKYAKWRRSIMSFHSESSSLALSALKLSVSQLVDSESKSTSKLPFPLFQMMLEDHASGAHHHLE
jgi:hypothetical protein